MNRRKPSSTGAFNSLPIELNKMIVHRLEADRDVATFRLISRATKDAVDADGRSFWRVRFRDKYDLKDGLSNVDLARLYQKRARQLRRGTGLSFFRGHRKRERQVVETLRDLIVESFQGSSAVHRDSRPASKNQTCLVKFILASKIFFNNRRAPQPAQGEKDEVDSMLAAVKLMCSHFLFDLHGAKHDVFGIEDSQRAVYLPTNQAPIYRGPGYAQVNMPWMLHNLNFFRYHMMDQEAGTLFDSLEALSSDQKPSAWRQILQAGSHTPCKHWKGTYSYLDQAELRKIRKLRPDKLADEYFVDKNVEEGKIQSLELNYVRDAEQLRWPQLFEDRLHSLRNVVMPGITTQGRSKPKAAQEAFTSGNIQFAGRGEDLDDDFYAIGWLNPLPCQFGIPGWQRVTFMKHFMDDFDQFEQDNLWAYEGVMLPGGRIILGRWWYASERVDFDNDYNGPFILWAVDPEPELQD